jgi:hypothetical protein
LHYQYPQYLHDYEADDDDDGGYDENDDEDMYAEAVQDFHYEHYENSYSYSSSSPSPHVNAHDQKLVPNSHGHDEIMMDWNDPVVLHNLNLSAHGLEHEHEHDNDNGDLFS